MSENHNPAASKQNLITSPKWKHPSEVMALHKLKMKKKALQARINRSISKPQECLFGNKKPVIENEDFKDKKRRNPFTRESQCKKSKDIDSATLSPDLDISADNTLFKLLNLTTESSKKTTSDVDATDNPLKNFTNALNELTNKNVQTTEPIRDGHKNIPTDWTIKTKMRIISKKPFKWSTKLRTSEEASGITGFVRCLDTTSSRSLDTSMSARCYQCCLLWQHPTLPWLDLFPRNGRAKQLSATQNFISTNQHAVNALHSDWTESFRSLFQLVRAKQCPFFYVCANAFTILFRAAGICGFSETHAFITPTTRGFRQTLKQEDIEYKMPFKKSNSKRNSGSSTDLGYETLDSSGCCQSVSENKDTNIDDDDVDEEELESEEWLKSLGVDDSEIKKINSSQARLTQNSECSSDNTEASLITVEGVEAQALFNFLINCKSTISSTGAFAGIPPTLLAPVAFHGAALKSLKVRESKVRVDSSDYYSMELRGSILPHTIHSLAALLHDKDMEYSATFANLDNTSVFSKVRVDKKNESTNVFGQENLMDCGLSVSLIKQMCSTDPNQVQIIECIKFKGSSETYTWC